MPPLFALLATALLGGAPAAGPQAAAPPESQPGAGNVAGPEHGRDVVRLTEEGAPAGVLRFCLRGAGGDPMPGRLTFVPAPDGAASGARAIPELFPRTDGAPLELAVRRNVVTTLSGRGAVTVPPGRYEVWATRGLEWSAARRPLELANGQEVLWEPVLRREVDTAGWIGADFHLHTLTHSGHGDASLAERVLTLVGEGVELAVATDHNHRTDYGPTIEALGAGAALTAVVGNEVSVPVGHFNAFPLDPVRPVAPTDVTEAGALFRFLREEPNAFGVTPVVQLNHPRWLGIDYFNQARLDPVTGVSTSPAWSGDFDSVEVLNATEGWGYYDADVTDRPVGEGVHWVLGDWYALLNRGHRYTAVGNSDSHTVHFDFAGFPRNFVPSSTDDPAAIDVAEVVEAVRGQRTFTTLGPFVEASVGGESFGGFASARDGRVTVELRVQAASWIDCDRVVPVYNGHALEAIAVPATREPVRLEAAVELAVPRDGWIAFRAEGDESLAPVVDGGRRPVLPLAVTNPIWIDGDGDGAWSSPWEQALAAVSRHEAAVSLRRDVVTHLHPPEHALVLLAALERGRPFVNELVRSALRREDRRVRLTAARVAERVGDRSLVGDLLSALERPGLDGYARLTLLRAARASGARDVAARLAAHLPEIDAARYAHDVDALVDARPVTSWRVAGYFPSGGPGSLLALEHPLGYAPGQPGEIPGPERADGEKAGRAGEPDGRGEALEWVEGTVGADGYLDLTVLGSDPAESEGSFAYARTWLHSPHAREVLFALGSDDGCRLWVNGEVVYEDDAHHGPTPWQHVGQLSLREGWNHVLAVVENGVGAFGLYLRVLDASVASER